MRRLSVLGCITLLSIVAFASTANAQTEEAPVQQEAPPVVQPRFGVRYTTEGGGYQPFSNLEGFLPIFQTPGNNVTFLQGKLFLDDDSRMGGNLLLGHRWYSEKDNRTFGGYISYDQRSTSAKGFSQLGVGFETLGNLDFRVNAYLPLATSEKQIGASATGVIIDPTSRNLFLTGRTNQFQVGLSGVDAEVGTKLAQLGSGDLRGYVGGYYLSGGESREAFGWKTRLEARPTNFLNLGVSLQGDALFDTRAIFTVGLSFPGSGSTAGKSEQGAVLARMGDGVERNPIILVTNETRSVANEPAIDPVTGLALRVPTPIGAAALNPTNLAAAPAGTIFYINDGGTSPNSTGLTYTIPNGVQLISSAGSQSVNTQLGSFALPLSGTGTRPTITGPVAFAGSGTLSGFNITPVGSSNNLAGVSARPFGATQATVNINNNTITNSNRGIDLSAIDSAKLTANVSGNTITGAKDAGIAALASNNGQLNLTVANNTIQNTVYDTSQQTGGIGVRVNATDASKVRLLLTGNTIRNNQSLGVSVVASGTSDTSVIAESNTLTNNNTISGAENPPTPSAFDVAADSGTPKVCLRLNNNTASGNTFSDYSLYNGNLSGATFQVENTLVTNTGNITQQTFNGTSFVPATVARTAIGSTTLINGFSSVASGTCATP
ncbi:MAG: inverse autotransporter beta domain-containing protein [Scytonematopsis contorta HA4267-MV1]|jgi:hypothetical protein|nr:inverse autotransporter beta domain-containing protein [Scytonematopsis contorta HA4267-MV1]